MNLDIAGHRIRRIVVLGFGITGRAVAGFCVRVGLPVAVSDANRLSDASRTWLRAHGVPYEDGGHTAEWVTSGDAVILSPGVSIDSAVVVAAREAGLLVSSELDLAQSQVPSIPIVAVTGTNGKGTTVTLIDAILRSAGVHTSLGGNIGTPFISLVDRIEGESVVVLEVSSYQLEQSVRFRPTIGVLLNLAPDHLERHRTMSAYAAAKGRLLQFQREDDTAVLPFELRDRFRQGRARRRFYDEPYPNLPAGWERLSPHNRRNLAAALTAVDALAPNLDLSGLAIDRVAGAFALPHRMEEVGSVAGIRAIDDSKSTNADAAIAALRSVEGPVVLLLGGRHKRAGYDALAREIRTRDVRHAVLFGEAAERLAEALAAAGIRPLRATDLEAAVTTGLTVARPGDTLLFSPACSSHDAFTDYAARGDAFVRLIRAQADDGHRPHKDLSP